MLRTSICVVSGVVLGGIALFAAAPNPAPPRSAPRPAAAAKSTASRPASGFGFSSDAPPEQSGLPDINRRIALDAANLIKSKQFAEAAAVLDESDRRIREFAAAARMELWDSTIAPMMRLIDVRRATLEKERATTQPAGAAAPSAAPRLSPDQNRLLAEVRSDLQGVSALIRQNDLASAEKSLAGAASKLQQLAKATRVPIWSVPLANAFQLVDARQSELREKKADAQEAARQKSAAASDQPQQDDSDDDPNPSSGLRVGTPAPSFAAVTLEGRPFNTHQFRGKYVLIDFWATWCGPCRAEMPHIRAAYEAYAQDKRLVVLSLSIDGQIATAAQFVARNNMPWAQGFLGEDSPVTDQYNVSGIPTILLVGPDGKVAANNLRGASIKQKLAGFLGQPATRTAAAPARP